MWVSWAYNFKHYFALLTFLFSLSTLQFSDLFRGDDNQLDILYSVNSYTVKRMLSKYPEKRRNVIA